MSSTIPFDQRDPRMGATARHHAAIQFIEQHAAMYLDEGKLLEQCATELVALHGANDPHEAHRVAVAALAEVQARTRPAWIDMSTSTSYVVRVIDPVTKRVASFTAAELIRIAETTDAEPADVGPPRHTGRPRYQH